MRPRVSVIIPVWNDRTTIARAIESVLSQQFDHAFEVLAVDDGSNDGTAAILAGFADRVRLLAQPRRGLAAARNAGAAAACGEYLAFLDADDTWCRQKLARTFEALARAPECSMAYSDALKVDDSDQIVAGSYYAGGLRTPSMDELLSDFYNILPSTIMMPRQAFDAAGGFCEQFGTAQPICEDAWFWLRIREHGPFCFVPQPLVRYAVRSSYAETLRRRGIAFGRPDNGSLSARIPALVENYGVLLGLVRNRYGRRARGLIGAIHRRRLASLTAAGLTAMAADDRIAARAIYRYALRLGPQRLKTAMRLGFSLMPHGVIRPLAACLPQRLARSMIGPAQV